ncbi:MAG: tyrosine-type recombinase/integrase, partial [Streptococcus sp.]|nr:tyrosine-type recombinase/integrase [Streptococcus sp.]
MGIRHDYKNNSWVAFHSMRHPVLRTPRRIEKKGLKSKAEALRVEKELVIELSKRLEEKTIPRWKQAVDECLAAKLLEGWTNKTHHTYDSCLKAHTSDWNKRRIDQITPHEIREKVLVSLEKKSESHRKNVLKFIRCVFNYAVERGYITKNPTPNLKFRVGDKVKAVLTEQQCKQWLAKAEELDSDWLPIWRLAIYTGMRSGELYALEWDSVDFENNRIIVRRSWNNKDGFKDTKSGDDRIIPISKS